MKRLFMIITLFISSFFLFSFKVNAKEYTKEVDFSLIETTLSLKEKLDVFIETDVNYSDYYFIYSDNGEIKYYIIRLNGSLDNLSIITDSLYFGLKYNASLKFGTNLNYIDLIGGASSNIFYLSHLNKPSSHLLYMNFDYYFTSGNSSITYNYNDFSITNSISSGNKLLTLYDVYLEYQKYLGLNDSVHKEELNKLSSFYSIVIDKLNYLSDVIVGNYIYLSIIVIFILIFVFKLIFRRYL